MTPLPRDISHHCLPHTVVSRCLMLLLCMLLALNVASQTPMTWEEFVENTYDTQVLTDEYADDEATATVDESFERLYYLQQNKINLNQTNAEQLRQLPFLSVMQIEAIVYYLDRNRPMRSLGELMLIPQLDYDTRRRLMLFCYAGDTADTAAADSTATLRSLLRFPHHTLMLSTSIPMYTVAGFQSVSDSVLQRNPNRVYRGNNSNYSLRYRLDMGSHVAAGIQVEKDAGERTVDYISAWVMIRDLGRVSRLVAGDYRLSFGQGLVMGQGGLSFGKQSWMSTSYTASRGLRQHSSMTESGYMRGVAATMALTPSISVTPFVSYTDIDATLTASRDAATSLKTDGLHRTLLERSKRGAIHNLTMGGNVEYRMSASTLDFTAVHTHLSLPLQPRHDTPSTAYRLYNLSGNHFGALSVAYHTRLARLTIEGEVAHTTASRGFATTHFLRYRPSASTNLLLALRHFDKHYATMYGSSMSENTHPQNETGVMAGVRSEVTGGVYVEAYTDFFRFPYSRSDATGPSTGADIQGQLRWQSSRSQSWQLRYRMKTKQRDCDTGLDSPQLFYATSHTLRLQHDLQTQGGLTATTAASLALRFNPDSDNESGYMISERMGWQSPSGALRLSASLAYFHTDSYATRLYAYEPSLLYSMGMSAFYYHGMRFALVASLKVHPSLTLCGKVGATRYFDRHTIGSGLNLINNSHREDLSLQLRWVLP